MRIKQNLYNFVYDQHWTIGFIISPVEDIIMGKPYEVHFVNGMPRDRWFADPFILHYDEQFIQVLVEEFCYKVKKGRIAKLTIDRNGYRLLSYKIVLDLPSHLSFPFIERKEGKVYISPENSASGCWCKYEYNVDNDEITKVQIIAQEPLTDAIVTDVFGSDMIFATHIPSQNGKVLTAYDANGVKKQEIEFQSNIARNAGSWFVVGEKVYRPAQDCNEGYGSAVILQRVDYDHNTFVFNDVRRIVSPNTNYTTGCHTFNHYKGLTVIDVHGWRRPLIVKTVKALKRVR